jgi:hypothetical protein
MSWQMGGWTGEERIGERADRWVYGSVDGCIGSEMAGEQGDGLMGGCTRDGWVGRWLVGLGRDEEMEEIIEG